MFANEFKLTGKLKFIEDHQTNNGNLIVTAVLGRGSKEKGYENYKIKAFKDVATGLLYVEENTVITVTGWITQDNWEKDGQKFSKVVFCVKSFEEYEG